MQAGHWHILELVVRSLILRVDEFELTLREREYGYHEEEGVAQHRILENKHTRMSR